MSLAVDLPARFNTTFRVEVIIASVVFGVIALLLLLAIIRSFTGRGRQASQRHEYTMREGSYTVFLAVVAAGLITFSLTEDTSNHPKPALTVQVTGYQWCWRFAYAGTPVSVTGDCVSGDIPTLRVPAREVVRFEVTSADVIHSFWIPVLRYKTWAYPNFTNTFQTTVPGPGEWLAQCAEFCGLYHYAMHFRFQTMPAADFQSWLRDEEGASR